MQLTIDKHYSLVDLKTIMPSEKSQIKKSTYCMILFI